MYIDAHHHLWAFDPIEYDWIDDSMKVLKTDFQLSELKQTLSQNGFSGSIAVQARQTLEETNWLLSLAKQTDLIRGVVGWIDLKSPDLQEQLSCFTEQQKLVGFRHVIQGETDPDFMRNPDFIKGLQTLADKGYRYDLLIFAHQLPAAIEMLANVPSLHVVIDHIAKPNIKTGDKFEQWQQNMNTLAQNPKVFCKLSGMVTEADWQHWSTEDLQPYMRTVLELFGEKRVMFGSDWPVCLVAGEYQTIKQLVLDFINDNAPQAKDDIFGNNAGRFYQI
ncbi:amidohydrolase family protein [Thalassotalea crassostreae]|uniref:amidohydrolase family protein n=1 Tax=Thalassotalea crassostreae TaxID=1763536 RepID=UPI000837E525|nr:amidohydrolase family protein [Thalassotalea crassostreae]